MYTCLLCKYPTELDDVMAPTQRGTCICLRCCYREIGDTRRPRPALRRSIELLTEEAA